MSGVVSEFDVLVVGGGINGLTVGAYLAKVGLKIAVIERRDQVGAHAVTEEHSVPGFRTSTHATAMSTGLGPCMADLELDKFGLDVQMHNFSGGMPFSDGKAFVPNIWNANDFYKKLSRFSARDAAVFKDINNAQVKDKILSNFLEKVFYAAPSPERWDYMVGEFAKLPHIPSDWWNMTAFELADLLYEDDHLKAELTSLCGTINLTPHEKVSGALGIVALSSSISAGYGWGQAMGGAHQIPHALLRCIVHYGGKILQSCEVEKIIIEDGEAKGVLLSKYSAYPERMIVAKRAIISDLTPAPTFLDLIGEDHLDRTTARVIKLYDCDWHTLFTTSCMTSSLPEWKSAEFDTDILSCWGFNLGVDSMEDVQRATSSLLSGRIPKPINAIGGCFVLSLYDKTAAPPGFHNVQFWSDVPFNIRKLGGPEKWDDIKNEIADQVIAMVDEYAVGFRQSVKQKVAVTPLDIYRRNPSALFGTVAGGALKPGQLYFDRPFLGCNAPRTPLKKLYLSNGIWPLCSSWLASGYIAASEVLADLGIRKPDWWSHRPGDWYESWTSRNNIAVNPIITV